MIFFKDVVLDLRLTSGEYVFVLILKYNFFGYRYILRFFVFWVRIFYLYVFFIVYIYYILCIGISLRKI